jgi:hypothetical protein
LIEYLIGRIYIINKRKRDKIGRDRENKKIEGDNRVGLRRA